MSQKLFKDLNIPKDHYSFVLLDLESEKVIAKHRENTPMILASVSKLFTSFYALKTLGNDYQFRVTVSYDGKIQNGILEGDLYLKSNGAPYLLANHMVSLIQQIQIKGIKKVNGNFYIDDSALAFTPKLSTLGLEDQTDNPSMGALNVEFNRFKIWNKKQAHPPLKAFKIVTKNLKEEGLKFSNQQSSNDMFHWQVNSNEKIRNWEEVPTRNSSMYAAYFFQYLANLHGLHITSPKKRKLPIKAKLLASYEGLPLYRLTQLGLEYSNNLISETMLKASAKNQTNMILSSKESAKVMHQWLQKTFKTVPWKKSEFVNGSGLTLSNKVSALTMTKYLQSIQKEKFGPSTFWSLLSINAQSGGIRKRIKNPEYAYRIYAKTGSLYYVNNLAGYLIAKSNKKYAFALFFTEQEKRKALNGTNSIKKEKLRKNSSRFYKKTTQLQDQILQGWIDKL